MPFARNAGASALVWIWLANTLVSSALAARCDLAAGVSQEEARQGLCKFDSTQRAFQGTPGEQVACLTRKVGRGASIGEETITDFLRNLVGKPAPTIEKLKHYIGLHGLQDSEIGGSITKPITAAYFIVHDTSSPNCSVRGIAASKCPVLGEFPPNRDDASWVVNKNFDGHPQPAPHRLAHMFTNRAGGSVTEADFATDLPTTKFESCVDKTAKVGLFVGVENIQPRVGVPPVPAAGRQPNDLDAPQPGFSATQYERLALLYLVASVRRGTWLVPAFHAVIDSKYRDGHDDPQRFDMAAFSSAVEKHVHALDAQ